MVTPWFCGLFVSCLWTENTPTLYRLVKVEFPIIFRIIMSPWFLSWYFLKLIFPIYFPYISHMFPIYVPYISHIFPIYVPYISHIFPIYFPYMSHIFPIYFPYMSHIFPIYFPYISHICPIYVPLIIPYIQWYQSELSKSSGGLAAFGRYEALGSLRAMDGHGGTLGFSTAERWCWMTGWWWLEL